MQPAFNGPRGRPPPPGFSHAATPRQLVEPAHEQGFSLDSKPASVITWLKETYGLGHGHAMAVNHVITKGDRISSRHVGSAGTHRDASDRLWLDGKATRPADR